MTMKKDVLNMTFEERVKHPKSLLCLDFDGVIHHYRQGYKDGSIYDQPVPGVKEAIQKYLEVFDIVIFSARANTQKGRKEMREWLKKHDLPLLPLTSEKPPAFLTIDDRAVTFDGTFPDTETLEEFVPWNQVGWKK